MATIQSATDALIAVRDEVSGGENARNAQVNTFIASFVSHLSRTYHVDSISGSDSNAGTSSAKFQTIKKAIDSVPIGGVGAIILIAGQTYNIDNNIHIENKTIRFPAHTRTTVINFNVVIELKNSEFAFLHPATFNINTPEAFLVSNSALELGSFYHIVVNLMNTGESRAIVKISYLEHALLSHIALKRVTIAKDSTNHPASISSIRHGGTLLLSKWETTIAAGILDVPAPGGVAVLSPSVTLISK